jgi:hypothetical protein
VALAGASALAGLLLGGVGTAEAAPVPSCGLRALRVVDAGTEGAAGTIYHLLRFTNVTRTTCSLRGYPGVSFTDARGRQIGLSATRDTALPVTRVVLRPGASAHAAVGIPQAENFPPATCRARTSTYVRVYPPNAYASRLLPLRTSVCTTTSGRVHVQAVVAGPGAA